MRLFLTPRSSGSVGDVILRPSYAASNQVRYFIRYVFDVSIFFIINIICVKFIFQGIMIDTFARKPVTALLTPRVERAQER